MPIKIGTRDSKLAMWQANKVKDLLEGLGLTCELVAVKSPGDRDLTTPLHQFGSTGVFTKVLDDALADKSVDIAVHSLKDYPTNIPEGIAMPAILERASSSDILVYKEDLSFLTEEKGLIATGSIRRVAQWKSKYPGHESTGLRGNVQTRLKKLADNPWDGAIFAKAGLERVGLLPEKYAELDWMIPAPAQGAISIACRAEDEELKAELAKVNHTETALLVKIERDFLNRVEGGCSAPIGALATIVDNEVKLQAGVFSLDGSSSVLVEMAANMLEAEGLGINAAKEALANGAKEIMQELADA